MANTIIISSAELRENMKKYLDLSAEGNTIYVQRGRTETFVLTKQEYFKPDDDLRRSLSLKEIMPAIEEVIEKKFRK